MQCILLPVDGSENALRATRFLIRLTAQFKKPAEIHLLNVQHSFPGTIRGVAREAREEHQRAGLKALAAARKLLDDAGVKYDYHISVGDVASITARYVKGKNIDQVVMGTRGLGAIAGLLMGSVATKVLHLVSVPVLLVP